MMALRLTHYLLLALPLGLAGIGATVCGTTAKPAGSESSANASPDATQTPPGQYDEARRVVEEYLDAAKRRDLASGRLLVCADVRSKHDATATNAGVFADQFTLVEYSIANARPEDSDVQIRATQAVSVAGRTDPLNTATVFTVADTADGWCIARALPDPEGS